ncbi:MAG: YfcE family phosphodiesterase [Oscillospiraceae bacterium]|nr:YfcE family phosphodiesterase [Oscillospiraceae bacterium]
MRAAVFSDTHTVTAPMVHAVAQSHPDVLIHLGDHERDAAVLLENYPELPLYQVAGNCDFHPNAMNTLVVQLGPVRVLLTHGHLYGVDYNHVDRLVYAAQEAGAGLVLFGHTHVPYHEDIGGVKVVNPGTAGKGRNLTCAMLEIFDNGGIDVSFINL